MNAQPTAVLEALAGLAGECALVALLWHLIALTVLVCLYIGWRPSRRNAALGASLPIASVALLSALGGLPLIAALAALLALALAASALRLPSQQPVQAGPAWARVAAALLIALGWLYPHFAAPDGSPLALVAVAPLGVVPGATLAAVVGFALAAGGLGTRAFRLLLALGGAAWGLYGAFVLGLFSELALIAGSTALAIVTVSAPAGAPAIAPTAARSMRAQPPV